MIEKNSKANPIHPLMSIQPLGRGRVRTPASTPIAWRLNFYFLRQVAVIFLAFICVPKTGAVSGPLKLSVDAQQVARRILHVTMTIPTAPGPITLVYPKWIPGQHSPVGPINDVVGLKFTSGGAAVLWQRDDVDMYAFHLQVPLGASEVEAEFYLTGTSDESGYLLGNSSAQQQMMLDWDQVILYPLGVPTDAQTIQAQLTLPAAWKFGTALAVDSQEGQVITFKPVSVTMLVDSPLLAGARLREIDITPPGETRIHKLDLAAESAAALDIPEDVIAHYRRLVAETGALFKARHYEHYNFLVWLHGTYQDGLEHHQSSDNRLPEMGLADAQWRRIQGDLLGHEMVHSWNGKYRRPAGLATPNYQEPIKGDLLWVYEGLTNYLGQVLAARSGLWTPDDYRDRLALIAAELDNRPGRSWRPLQDTAVSAPILYGSSPEWEAWRRSADFYEEGSLLWLEVDTIIRTQSKGTKTLDDFCRVFEGGESTPPVMIPYTFDDIVTALNSVVPYDWRGLFHARLTSLSPHAALDGIYTAGWRLTYTDTPSELNNAMEAKLDSLDMRFSIGMLLDISGKIVDVLPGTPSDIAGLAPGMSLIAVNRRHFSPQVLRDALKRGKDTPADLDLIITNQDDFLTVRVEYHAGERYPRLERDGSKPDMLSSILAPLSAVR
ncbi:Glycyl aminopeptidase. Metallo peptidase. MEROPS family M61 [Candidatus Sulfotelmatobacter kueseliae]|uniref:Glycyl aminopeptidase. Metallo peptidase. MEROPS family M61 n=1 Tax=Candidatus Sulfotelmatobacter kueseliae TaxID=2042962 RepID=A0A2U3LDM4_9BACT|nr:Glycyl aminopeptidase. Metallo peptidase. MEROPS family M61 [Candidatus Sulfotelmatobacter kueseliae]